MTEITIRHTGAALISLTAATHKNFLAGTVAVCASGTGVLPMIKLHHHALAEVLDNQEALAILFGPNVLGWSMMVAD